MKSKLNIIKFLNHVIIMVLKLLDLYHWYIIFNIIVLNATFYKMDLFLSHMWLCNEMFN